MANHSYIDPVAFKDFILSKLKHNLMLNIPSRDFEQLSINAENDCREIAFYIQRECFGEKIVKNVDVHYIRKQPKNVWQHFKMEYFPKFLLNFFPVKMEKIEHIRTIKFERDFVFPDVYIEKHEQLGRFIIKDLHPPKYIFEDK